MPGPPEIKPTHKPVKDYYAALAAYARQKIKHETALRSAFQNLLEYYGRKAGWTLIPELTEVASTPRGGRTRSEPRPSASGPSRSEPEAQAPGPPRATRTRPDGTFRDDFYIERGHWEAKDTGDDLDTQFRGTITLDT